jgi:hypothetical protein
MKMKSKMADNFMFFFLMFLKFLCCSIEQCFSMLLNLEELFVSERIQFLKCNENFRWANLLLQVMSTFLLFYDDTLPGKFKKIVIQCLTNSFFNVYALFYSIVIIFSRKWYRYTVLCIYIYSNEIINPVWLPSNF